MYNLSRKSSGSLLGASRAILQLARKMVSALGFARESVTGKCTLVDFLLRSMHIPFSRVGQASTECAEYQASSVIPFLPPSAEHDHSDGWESRCIGLSRFADPFLHTLVWSTRSTRRHDLAKTVTRGHPSDLSSRGIPRVFLQPKQDLDLRGRKGEPANRTKEGKPYCPALNCCLPRLFPSRVGLRQVR